MKIDSSEGAILSPVERFLSPKSPALVLDQRVLTLNFAEYCLYSLSTNSLLIPFPFPGRNRMHSVVKRLPQFLTASFGALAKGVKVEFSNIGSPIGFR